MGISRDQPVQRPWGGSVPDTEFVYKGVNIKKRERRHSQRNKGGGQLG